MLAVSPGRRTHDKDSGGMRTYSEESRQEDEEVRHRVTREVTKAKQKEGDELNARLDTRGGEKDLNRAAGHTDMDAQQILSMERC